MSNPTSNQVLRPENPVLVKDANVPRENGQTRFLPDGSLLYHEPLTNTDVPAVRLEDIRPRLVKEASRKKSYRFSKKRGFDDTNVTAFVKKDYNYGPKRENRPDCLFQIESDKRNGEKPDGYVMNEGRIVLDAFDHGLRNFCNQLPMYVSSELEGHDIEYYLRRNREISVYDLVARAPNGYWKGKPDTEKKNKKMDQKPREWHDGPPRVGTFSMRATRFRLGAGCLSWEKKDGTTAKNKRILDIIPAQYKDPAVNSTKGWRDLNLAEKKRIKDGAMKKPQQGPKAKRAAQAEKEKAEKEGPNEYSVEREDLLNDEEMILYGDKDAWIGASNPQENGVWPGFDPKGFESSTPPSQVYHMDPLSSNPGQLPSVVDENSLATKNEPTGLDSMQPRKRSRRVLDADSDQAGSLRAQKRIRATVNAQDPGQKRDISRIPTSSMARQRQREPASGPYAAGGTLSPTTRSMTGSNYLSSGSPPSRHQSEISHRNNGVNPPIQIQREDAGAEFGLQVQGPSDYEYPTLGTPGPSPPMHRVAWQGGSRDQPSGLIQSQRMPLAPKTIGKRKRADGSTNENVEGQCPMKQTKRHTRKPAPAPTLQGPFESVPGAEMSTPEHWQVSTQNAVFPQLVNSLPGSFQTLLPSAHGALWNGRGGPFGPMPPIEAQQGMPNNLTTGSQDIDPYLQAHDFIHFDPELHPGPGRNVHALPDFHLGQ